MHHIFLFLFFCFIEFVLIFISDFIFLQYLQQIFAVQVPLLDAVVSRAAEQNVPLDHQ